MTIIKAKFGILVVWSHDILSSSQLTDWNVHATTPDMSRPQERVKHYFYATLKVFKESFKETNKESMVHTISTKTKKIKKQTNNLNCKHGQTWQNYTPFYILHRANQQLMMHFEFGNKWSSSCVCLFLFRLMSSWVECTGQSKVRIHRLTDDG